MPTISPRLALARDLTRCAALEVDGARVAMERLARRVCLMSDVTYEDTFLAVIAEREAIFQARGGPRERFYPDRRPAVEPHTFLPIREASDPDPEVEPVSEPEPERVLTPPLQPSLLFRWLSIAVLVVVLLAVAVAASTL